MLGQPNKSGVIRLASPMKQLDLLVAYRQGKRIVVNLVRAPLTDGIDVIGKVELLSLNDAVEPVQRFVTAQPAQHVPLGYDIGGL